jgi:hypothetical protein
MCFPADELLFASDPKAGRESLGLHTTSTITTSMGTGTGSHPRAWTA